MQYFESGMFLNWKTSWNIFLGYLNWYHIHNKVNARFMTFSQDYRLFKKSNFEKYSRVNSKANSLNKWIQSNDRMDANLSCTILLIWHKYYMHWLSVPCHIKLLDKATLNCVNITPNFTHIIEDVIKTVIHVRQKDQDKISNVFTCDDKTMISSQKICDLERDCTHLEDESLCSSFVFNHSLADVLHLKWIFGSNNTSHTLDNHTGSHIENPADRQVDYSCFSEEIECIYDTYENKSLRFCVNGYHLESCEEYVCQKTFKCAGYYCIPWRYVCNGFWDCPLGFDENDCKREEKPGFYHCSNSSVFILLHSICDVTVDCPMGDDEKLCDLYLAECPQKCFCFLYSMFCENIMPQGIAAYMPHRYLQLAFNVIFSEVLLFLAPFQSLFFLNVSNNDLSRICFQSMHINFLHLVHLHATHNKVPALEKSCFENFANAKVINLMRNQISQIECSTFHKNFKIAVLNLIYNKVTHLKRCHMFGLLSLALLKIGQNSIVHVDLDLFQDITRHRIFVISDKNMFCCLGKEIKCSAGLLTSCHSVLSNQMSLALWTISVLGICTSVFFLFSDLVFIFYGLKHSSITYKWITSATSINSVLFFLVLLVIAVIDGRFGTSFIFHKKDFQQSTICHSICLVFLFSCFANIFLVSLMAGVRYRIIHDPFKARTDHLFFSPFVILALASIFTSSALLTSLFSYFNEFTIVSKLCLPITSANRVVLGNEISIVFVCIAIVSSFSLPLCYFKIITEVTKESKKLSLTSVSKSQCSLVANVSLPCIIHGSSWVPLSVVLIVKVAIVKSEIGDQLLPWTIATVLPISFGLHPLLLGAKSFQSDCAKFFAKKDKKDTAHCCKDKSYKKE